MPESKDRPVIMLVDDEQMALTSLNALFALETDYHVLCFTQPRQALEEAARTPIDLVISDFAMPELNGLELIQRLQRIQPDCIAILLTGFADKENAVRAINELELFQFLEKPWNNDQLLLVVRRGLRQKRLTRQLTDKVKELDGLLSKHRELQERHGVLERELEMAARVQRSLLPDSMPDVYGFSFSTFFEPCREIGGDYYGFLSSPECAAVLLADVSGHGVQAALTSMLLKATFEEAFGHCRSAIGMVEEMNDRLFRFLPGGMFVAATLARIHTEGAVELAAAGLPYPFALRATEARVDEIPVGGMPMGIFGRNGPASFETQEVQLAPGDVLLLASDGIGDVQGNGDELFQDERLATVIADLKGQPGSQVIEGLVDAARQFAGGREVPDDISLVTITR